MGSGRRIGPWAVGAVVALALCAGSSGCVLGGGSSDPVSEGRPYTTASASTGSPETSDPGAAVECLPVSAAALAAVNAAMTVPDFDPASAPPVMTELVAAHDPEHAVWLLVGTYDRIANSDGHLVVWATTADPTFDTFDSTLRAIGGGTASITSAPTLQFPDVGPGGFPTPALHCAAASSR